MAMENLEQRFIYGGPPLPVSMVRHIIENTLARTKAIAASILYQADEGMFHVTAPTMFAKDIADIITTTLSNLGKCPFQSARRQIHQSQAIPRDKLEAYNEFRVPVDLYKKSTTVAVWRQLESSGLHLDHLLNENQLQRLTSACNCCISLSCDGQTVYLGGNSSEDLDKMAKKLQTLYEAHTMKLGLNANVILANMDHASEVELRPVHSVGLGTRTYIQKGSERDYDQLARSGTRLHMRVFDKEKDMTVAAPGYYQALRRTRIDKNVEFWPFQGVGYQNREGSAPMPNLEYYAGELGGSAKRFEEDDPFYGLDHVPDAYQLPTPRKAITESPEVQPDEFTQSAQPEMTNRIMNGSPVADQRQSLSLLQPGGNRKDHRCSPGRRPTMTDTARTKLSKGHKKSLNIEQWALQVPPGAPKERSTPGSDADVEADPDASSHDGDLNSTAYQPPLRARFVHRVKCSPEKQPHASIEDGNLIDLEDPLPRPAAGLRICSIIDEAVPTSFHESGSFKVLDINGFTQHAPLAISSLRNEHSPVVGTSDSTGTAICQRDHLQDLEGLNLTQSTLNQTQHTDRIKPGSLKVQATPFIDIPAVVTGSFPKPLWSDALISDSFDVPNTGGGIENEDLLVSAPFFSVQKGNNDERASRVYHQTMRQQKPKPQHGEQQDDYASGEQGDDECETFIPPPVLRGNQVEGTEADTSQVPEFVWNGSWDSRRLKEGKTWSPKAEQSAARGKMQAYRGRHGVSLPVAHANSFHSQDRNRYLRPRALPFPRASRWLTADLDTAYTNPVDDQLHVAPIPAAYKCPFSNATDSSNATAIFAGIQAAPSSRLRGPEQNAVTPGFRPTNPLKQDEVKRFARILSKDMLDMLKKSAVWTGEVALKLKFGRLVALKAPKEDVNVGPHFDFGPYYHPTDMLDLLGKAGFRFNEILTPYGAEANTLANTNWLDVNGQRNNWSLQRTTILYEIVCRATDAKDDCFVIEIDAESFEFRIREHYDVRMKTNVHCPHFAWDMQATLTWSDTSALLHKYGHFATPLVQSLSVTSKGSRVGLGFFEDRASGYASVDVFANHEAVYIDNCSTSLLKITMKSKLHTNREDTKFEPLRHTSAVSQDFRPDGQDPTIRFEAAIVSAEIERGLEQNKTLEIGDRTPYGHGLWSGDVFESMTRPAVGMIQQMNAIGRHNDNGLVDVFRRDSIYGQQAQAW